MKMTENFYRSALIFCYHLYHTNFLMRDKKSVSMHINTQIQLICISNQSLLSDTHCSHISQTIKGASWLLPYTWVLLPCYHFCMSIFM